MKTDQILRREQRLSGTPDEVFEFFADAHNLEALTPPLLRFRVVTPAPIRMGAGTLIRYELRIRRVPVRWLTEITEWEPPHRFAYLWHMRRDRADATDVAVTFTAAGAGTDVRIVHDGWDRLGSDGQTWRDANRGGWDGLLPHFVSACTRKETS